MIKTLKLIAVLAVSTLTLKVHAGPITYLDKNGKQVSNDKAIQMSMAGEAITQCQPVKATFNAKGTTLSLKPIKN